jgi:hypothetical protein
MAATSLGLTKVNFLSLRMRPERLVPVKWRLPECARMIFPLAVILKRLAAPRWVFSFFFGFFEFLGIKKILSCLLAVAPLTETLYILLEWGAAVLRPY